MVSLIDINVRDFGERRIHVVQLGLVLDEYRIHGARAVGVEERGVDVFVEENHFVFGDFLHAVIGRDDEIEFVVQMMRFELFDQVAERFVTVGELLG